MRRAKQVEHATISCCFASGICQLRVKVLHLTVIISVSLSSTIPFFTKTNGYLLVANIGVSRSKTISFAKCDFGSGRWTNWPSSRSNKSCQGIPCGDHLKSFRNITSASSAPIQAKLVVAGLVNVWKMLFSGFKRTVFPQFAGPVSIIFLYLPRPLHKSSFTARANDLHEIPLCSSSSVADACHRDACLHVHGSPLAS